MSAPLAGLAAKIDDLHEMLGHVYDDEMDSDDVDILMAAIARVYARIRAREAQQTGQRPQLHIV